MNRTEAPHHSAVSRPFQATPYPEVRWGFIGTGSRGRDHIGTMLLLAGAHITALADCHPPTLAQAAALISAKERPAPALYGHDDVEGWRRVIERDDVDAVIISTAWEQHAPMAVAAMQAGKHVFIEVPAATTIDECWQLVDTAESTGMHCMMLENCNYGREELMLLNMVRKGLLGEILHGEAAYIHELREQMFDAENGEGAWRTWHHVNTQGNLYTTHGVGPLAHCMDVNRGDYFDTIVSMSSPARGRQLFARENLAPGHRWNAIQKWNCGDINTSMIKPMSGKTMMVQWDETSPRPYSRHNLLQGTRGTFAGFPNRIALDYELAELPEAIRATTPSKDGRTDYHEEWDLNMEPWFESYDHPLWKKLGAEAEAHGGHDGMDYIMLWRVQHCLLTGQPLDQSVYDAALWSAIGPLSSRSVENGSAPQQFPDFTRGKWKMTPPICASI